MFNTITDAMRKIINRIYFIFISCSWMRLLLASIDDRISQGRIRGIRDSFKS